VAVVVNGQNVPTSTFRLLLEVAQHQAAPGSPAKGLAARTMNQLVVFELVRQYAVAHNITLSNAEIDNHVKLDEKRSGGTTQFRGKLKQFGLTVATYKSLLRYSLLGSKVQARVSVVSNVPQPVAHVRHILIGTHIPGRPARTSGAAHAVASQVLAQLNHGGNWKALAKKYSDDKQSGAQGGDLGTVYPHQMVGPFDHAAFTLPLKQPTIVQTQFGYHIIEVLARGKAPLPPRQAAQLQQTKFSRWLSNQMKHARIKRLVHVA